MARRTAASEEELRTRYGEHYKRPEGYESPAERDARIKRMATARARALARVERVTRARATMRDAAGNESSERRRSRAHSEDELRMKYGEHFERPASDESRADRRARINRMAQARARALARAVRTSRRRGCAHSEDKLRMTYGDHYKPPASDESRADRNARIKRMAQARARALAHAARTAQARVMTEARADDVRASARDKAARASTRDKATARADDVTSSDEPVQAANTTDELARPLRNAQCFAAVHEYYSASVAPIVQNSARLRTATPGTTRCERLTHLVIKDIESYFYVSDERKAEIVREFNEAAREPKMLVCTFCGMRDPDMHYEESRYYFFMSQSRLLICQALSYILVPQLHFQSLNKTPRRGLQPPGAPAPPYNGVSSAARIAGR